MEVHSGSQRNDVRDVRILSETELDTEVLMNAIRGTGYEVGTIQKEPYKKRGLFG